MSGQKFIPSQRIGLDYLLRDLSNPIYANESSDWTYAASLRNKRIQDIIDIVNKNEITTVWVVIEHHPWSSCGKCEHTQTSETMFKNEETAKAYLDYKKPGSSGEVSLEERELF